ncbi:MAG: Gfo/Idh/MocA family oxidoreductase [bacterium]|nr:Gfo/Idh/MocA family oxidoreductase [bacterium]
MAKMGIMSFAHMHAYSYAACLKELPEADFTAVWDDDLARGKKAAGDLGVEFIESLDDFLATDVEGVVVTSENVKHREMVEKAAAAKKWVLCEKPLATTVADCQAMIDACKSAGVGLGTAFPCRYLQPFIGLKQQLDNGDLGAIYAASCTNNGRFPGGWFAQMDLAGGGATMDHTVHVADLLRWLLGKEFTKVYCENGKVMGRDTDLDDCGVLQLEMEGGVKIAHVASWNRAASFPTWGDVTMELIGEKGVTSIDAFNQKINVYNDETMKAEWAYWGDTPDMGLVRDFVKAVDTKGEPPITGEDGLRALAVTAAAYESAKTGKAVAID